MPERKLTILMADNDAGRRAFARDAFESMPVLFQFIVDGLHLSAYLLFHSMCDDGVCSPPDLILLNLCMPGWGEKEAFAAIQANSCLKSVPVVSYRNNEEVCALLYTVIL